MARRSLYEFVRQAWPEVESVPFVDNWHIGAICDHLQAVSAGQIPKLLINVPPGLGKSLLTCVFWPAWEWASDPSVRWFFASYDQQLSTRDSVRCRALIGTAWYRRRCRRSFRLNSEQNQKTYYETDQGGYRLASSIGGHASGEHPDRIVCDDPHNVQQAESTAERQATLDWWDLTMSSRGVSRYARRVIIMQRLHQSDLSGHVLAEGGWVHICLPMRCERGRMILTPLNWIDPRIEEGTLLCPEQFGEPAVADLEKRLGLYGTAGQLQQRPAPREGGMFKAGYFNQRVKAAPYHATRARYWDRAATQDGGCYTAGVLMAHHDGNWYVEDVVHGQWEPDTRDQEIVAAALRDRVRYGPHHEPTIWIEQEPGSSGIDAYKHTARKLSGFRVFPDRPTGAKEVRAEPWASQCAAKNVYLVEDGTWDVQGWITEHCLFPMGDLKDRVDASSGALAKLAKPRPVGMLRVLGSRSRHRCRGPRIVLCTPKQRDRAVMEQWYLSVSITDPSLVATSSESTANLASDPDSKLLGWLQLSFADLDPADCQETWAEAVAPFGQTPDQLIMTQPLGKKLWSFLLRKRDPTPAVYLLEDDNERRALSVAYAICDSLGLNRAETIYRVGAEMWTTPRNEVPANKHIYEMTRRSRSCVI
jgi:predicted phage terminase large subunit-like protein